MRIAVVSPFVDRRHGTERSLCELLERLSGNHGVEIHLYSQRVEDLPVVSSKGQPAAADSPGIVWHRVSAIRGPHLFQFVFWYFANRFARWRDRTFGKLHVDFLYSPGINASDAKVVTVHIVFHALYRALRPQLRLLGTSPWTWPRKLHRLLYYRLLMSLERRIYTGTSVRLIAVSSLVAAQIREFLGRESVPVIPHGVDIAQFNPTIRMARRKAERLRLQLTPDFFVLLLIGNDWKTKGLDSLLRALSLLRELPLFLLVVGGEDSAPYKGLAKTLGVESKVAFLTPSSDVLQFYAAADAYVGPSLEDSYGLPVLEAMACGLPVIASAKAGVSELILPGENGLLLRDPQNSEELAALLRELWEDSLLRLRMSECGARTATGQSWETCAEKLCKLFEEVVSEGQGH